MVNKAKNKIISHVNILVFSYVQNYVNQYTYLSVSIMSDKTSIFNAKSLYYIK